MKYDSVCHETRTPGATTPCGGAVLLGLCESHAGEYTDWLLQRSLKRHQLLQQIADSVVAEELPAEVKPRKPMTAARKLSLAKSNAKRSAKRS